MLILQIKQKGNFFGTGLNIEKHIAVTQLVSYRQTKTLWIQTI